MRATGLCRATVGILSALALGGVCAGQVDLTQPFEPDADTATLLHLDDVASGSAADAMGGPSGATDAAAPTLGRGDGAASFDGLGD